MDISLESPVADVQLTPTSALAATIDVSERRKPAGEMPYTVYRIDMSYDARVRHVWKRYRQFFALHEQLTAKFKASAARLDMPPKHWLDPLAPPVVSERLVKFDKYVKDCLATPGIQDSDELFAFLEIPRHTELALDPVYSEL
eukprot:TRINITY_DN31409_c0_g1_i1.p1 TRINITY_DN31409_c0_g1~~TRINITY_DN31409_c0_g1_i1.p1  ORF type:complete len:143 (-),score=26.64 TRINITY_DN31409_c0_g1_i1:186-614(-)